MRSWANRFATVFGLGFVILAYAIGSGAAIGQALSLKAGLLSLRHLGAGLMLSGMTLWVAKARIEGNRPGLNPMFSLLLSFSALLLVVGVILAAATGDAFTLGLQAGLALAAAALVVGLLAQLISPPEHTPVYDYPWSAPGFDPATDAYAAGHTVPNIGYGQDDLERIAGIDAPIKALLKEAGIRYFSQLADTSPEDLRQILADGGLETIDPATWPDQARLAANREWETLRKLQGALAARPAG